MRRIPNPAKGPEMVTKGTIRKKPADASPVKRPQMMRRIPAMKLSLDNVRRLGSVSFMVIVEVMGINTFSVT